MSEEALRYHSALKIYEPGTVLMAMYGATIGRLGILGIAACTNQACCALDEPARHHPKYAFYWLLAARAHIVQLASGGGQPNINQETIRSLRVATPPLATQRAIADFLDKKTAAIDELIAKKERLIELLQEKRQALITQAVTKGLDPNVPMKDSGIEWLGEIPAHWEVKRLKHLSPGVSVGVVITPAKYYDEQGTVPALRSLNIRERRIDLDNLVRISDESNTVLAKSRLRANDLVSVRTGQPGKTAVVPSALDGANCVDLIIVRQGARFVSRFVCEAMNSAISHRQYSEGSEGAIQQHFNIETAKNLLVATPPVSEQTEVAEHLAGMHDTVDRLLSLIHAHVERLREYRQALITEAVTGKLEIPELADQAVAV